MIRSGEEKYKKFSSKKNKLGSRYSENREVKRGMTLQKNGINDIVS